MPKSRWTGYALVVSSIRNRTRLRDRLTTMASESRGLHLEFLPPTLGVVRSGGMRGACATVAFTSLNDDENRLPTDIGRKVRDAMGDAEVGVHVVIVEPLP